MHRNVKTKEKAMRSNKQSQWSVVMCMIHQAGTRIPPRQHRVPFFFCLLGIWRKKAACMGENNLMRSSCSWKILRVMVTKVLCNKAIGILRYRTVVKKCHRYDLMWRQVSHWWLYMTCLAKSATQLPGENELRSEHMCRCAVSRWILSFHW